MLHPGAHRLGFPVSFQEPYSKKSVVHLQENSCMIHNTHSASKYKLRIQFVLQTTHHSLSLFHSLCASNQNSAHFECVPITFYVESVCVFFFFLFLLLGTQTFHNHFGIQLAFQFKLCIKHMLDDSAQTRKYDLAMNA